MFDMKSLRAKWVNEFINFTSDFLVEKSEHSVIFKSIRSQLLLTFDGDSYHLYTFHKGEAVLIRIFLIKKNALAAFKALIAV